MSRIICDTHTSHLYMWYIHVSKFVWHAHVRLYVWHTHVMFTCFRHTWCLVQCWLAHVCLYDTCETHTSRVLCITHSSVRTCDTHRSYIMCDLHIPRYHVWHTHVSYNICVTLICHIYMCGTHSILCHANTSCSQLCHTHDSNIVPHSCRVRLVYLCVTHARHLTCVTRTRLKWCVIHTRIVYMCDTRMSCNTSCWQVWHTHVWYNVWHTHVSYNVWNSHVSLTSVTHPRLQFVWHTRISYICVIHTCLEYCVTHTCLVYVSDTHTSRLHVWYSHVSYDVWHTHTSRLHVWHTHVTITCVTHTRLV